MSNMFQSISLVYRASRNELDLCVFVKCDIRYCHLVQIRNDLVKLWTILISLPLFHPTYSIFTQLY